MSNAHTMFKHIQSDVLAIRKYEQIQINDFKWAIYYYLLLFMTIYNHADNIQ